MAGAAIFVLLHAIKGWQLGFPRAFSRLAAIGTAYVAGLWAAPLSPPAVRAFFKLPDVALSVICGAVVGLLTYLGVILVARVLFKKTSDQRLIITRLLFGATGAVVGSLTGLLFLWGIVITIRVLGTIAESQLPPSSSFEGAEISEVRAKAFDSENFSKDSQPNPLTLGFARLKQSLSTGVFGSLLEAVDPIPHDAYRIMDKIGRLVSSPEAVKRFFDFSGAETLIAHPKIRTLVANREIALLAERRNFQALLGSELVIAAANDPEVAHLIQTFPLEKALDFALDIRSEENSKASSGELQL